MAVLLDKNTRLIVQGLTGREGTFHAKTAAAYGTSEDEILTRFRSKIPLGRYSTPEEVAGLVGYLAGDTAASITSQALNVCGGLGNF